MYLYFLSTIPCAVKLNGEYLGVASENYSVLPDEKGLFEFVPLCRGYNQSCFVWNGKLVDDDENTRIIDLYGGFLIIPKFTRQVVSDFKELFFKTIDFPDYSVEVRVFTENGVKLSVGRGKDKVIENVPFSPSTLNLEKAFIDGKGYLVAFLSDKKTAVFGFEITNGILNGNGIRNVLKRECDGYKAENETVILSGTLNDILRHTVTSVWTFRDGVKLAKADICRGKEPYELPEKLLPYAFFEELRLGKDVSDFLTPKIRPRAEELKAFIGDFSATLPPPHFRADNEILLLYSNRAEYAAIDFAGRLIDNVKITSNGK